MAANKELLQTIIENPEDDAPRLVYADWLEEHGDLERAEFIRVQCELAGLDEFDPRRLELQQRERELERKRGDRWRKEMPVGARKHTEFRRGFIGYARLSAAFWLRSAARLHRAIPLEELSLSETRTQQFEIARSPYFARLTALSFCALGTEGVQALAASPHVANLRKVWLTGCGHGERDMRALA